MDYKDKYIKYKTKYLELKNMDINNQIGGGISKDIIDKVITDNKLLVSYSINYNDITINKNPNKIYPIHSISKLFTNIILVLLYNDKIINDEELNMPIKVDEYVLNKLSKDVKNRLKNVSILQCIKHEAGLKDYMDNYHNKLIDCFNQKKEFPNPIEPEDFLIYADKDVLQEKEIGKYNYSNLGILLVALSLKYYYNSINKTNLSYNQILTKYIIDKIKLKSFNITKPKLNGVFPIARDDLTKYVNGSPATSYWMSSNDLCKFGIWINKLFNSNKKIKKCITENKLDISWKNPLRLGHWGFLQTSSCCLEIYLKKNITIAILSNHNNDAHIFMNKIKKILK